MTTVGTMQRLVVFVQGSTWETTGGGMMTAVGVILRRSRARKQMLSNGGFIPYFPIRYGQSFLQRDGGNSRVKLRIYG